MSSDLSTLANVVTTLATMGGKSKENGEDDPTHEGQNSPPNGDATLHETETSEATKVL